MSWREDDSYRYVGEMTTIMSAHIHPGEPKLPRGYYKESSIDHVACACRTAKPRKLREAPCGLFRRCCVRSPIINSIDSFFGGGELFCLSVRNGCVCTNVAVVFLCIYGT